MDKGKEGWIPFLVGVFVMVLLLIMPQIDAQAAGRNGVAKAGDGNWYYYVNGQVQISYNSLAKYNGSWWYFEDGKLDFGYTGLCQYKGSWWYVEKGKVNFSATTLCKYNNTWWYVEKGKVNFRAKTLCKYGGNWWYVTGGKVDFGYEGLASNAYGLWYVYEGKVDFSALGTGTFDGVDYVVVNGKAAKEVPCNLSKSDSYYIYEFMYKNKIPPELLNLSEEQLSFYGGLKACLDEAYSYKTSYEQEKAVHDYIVLNCEYGSGAGSNRAEGVFVYKQAVCNGYAKAFKLCMDILGMPCITVSGVVDGNAGHVWNSVQLDGDWYVVDVTWDDPVPDKPGEISYQYFNITDAKLRERRTYETPVEATGTKYYYYATLPNYFTVEDGLDAYYAYIQEQYEKVGAGVEITVIVESKDAWEFSDTSAYRDESVLDDSNYYAAVKHFNGVYEFYWSFTKYVYY